MIGFDAQSVDEVETSLKKFGARYIRRLFTSYEVEYCSLIPVTEARRYAERFAAKEAVLKVLNVREVIPSWKEIETRQTSNGRPEVVLYGAAAKLARTRGLRGITLSISHAGGMVIAVAVSR